MSMLNRFLLLMLALLSLQGTVSVLHAEGEGQMLVLYRKNGQKIVYNLEDEPNIRFQAGKLVIMTDRLRAEYVLGDVVSYRFEGNIDAISTPRAKGTGFEQKGDEIVVYGRRSGEPVMLFNPAGALLVQKEVGSDGTASMTLAGQPKGVYVVTVGEESIKFMKR